ncbi:MAG: hypothetical protein R3B59_07810 [Dehalococcoidia bacterium]
MNGEHPNKLDPWGFRILLGGRLRKTLIITLSVFAAWTLFQTVLQLIYLAT